MFADVVYKNWKQHGAVTSIELHSIEP